MSKVALITGGASGMGLAVASALAERGGWALHILDLNAKNGEEIAKRLPNTTFHKADVTSYTQLGAAFKAAFTSSGNCLDFVFANAGVVEFRDFYMKHSSGAEPPPEWSMHSLDVDLKGVIYTSYLAQHYFRQSQHKGRGASLVITGSCCSLYPSCYSPMYTAAKYGVVGFLRSIAAPYHLDGIRANVICPGIVETNLVGEGGWSNFPRDVFTPVEMISKVVLMLVDGIALHDSSGKHVEPEQAYGQTVEISLDKYYLRSTPDFCDEAMRKVMAATSPEVQQGGVIKEF